MNFYFVFYNYDFLFYMYFFFVVARLLRGFCYLNFLNPRNLFYCNFLLNCYPTKRNVFLQIRNLFLHFSKEFSFVFLFGKSLKTFFNYFGCRVDNKSFGLSRFSFFFGFSLNAGGNENVNELVRISCFRKISFALIIKVISLLSLPPLLRFLESGLVRVPSLGFFECNMTYAQLKRLNVVYNNYLQNDLLFIGFFSRIWKFLYNLYFLFVLYRHLCLRILSMLSKSI